MFSMVGTMPASSARSAKKRVGPSARSSSRVAVLQGQAAGSRVRRDGVDVGAERPDPPREVDQAAGQLAVGLAVARQVEELAVERADRPLDQQHEVRGQPAGVEVGHHAVHRLGGWRGRPCPGTAPGRPAGRAQAIGELRRRRASLEQDRASHRAECSLQAAPATSRARPSATVTCGAYPSSALARAMSATRSPSAERPVGGTISEREPIACADQLCQLVQGRADAGRQVVHPGRRVGARRRLDGQPDAARHVADPGQVALLVGVDRQRLAAPGALQEDADDAARPLPDLTRPVHREEANAPSSASRAARRTSGTTARRPAWSRRTGRSARAARPRGWSARSADRPAGSRPARREPAARARLRGRSACPCAFTLAYSSGSRYDA